MELMEVDGGPCSAPGEPPVAEGGTIGDLGEPSVAEGLLRAFEEGTSVALPDGRGVTRPDCPAALGVLTQPGSTLERDQVIRGGDKIQPGSTLERDQVIRGRDKIQPSEIRSTGRGQGRVEDRGV